MAAFEDNLGPDLDQFSGCKWTDWKEAVDSDGIGGSSQESVSSSLSTRHEKEVATLKREDLGLFGFCPAKDNFYLVVCEHCHLPFKPQTFQYHVEKHHAGKPLKVESKIKMKPPENKSFTEPSSVSTSRSPVSKSSFVSIRNDTLPVERRPHPKQISVAIKNAFDKVPSKMLASRKASNAHKASSDPAISHQSHSGAATVSIKEQLRTKFRDDMQKPIPKKPHKPSRPPPEKLGRVDAERTKKVPFVNKSHHHSTKHSIHPHHPPNKMIKLGSNSQKNHGVDVDLPSSLRSSTNPEVVIKKLPISESMPKNQTFPSGPKQIVSSADPLRQYKHNHNPQTEIVKPVDRATDKIVIKKNDRISSVSTLSYMVKSEKNVPLKAREYDPNKHCGVRVESTSLPCTRSLTCKTHALRHKRKVPGRRKPYDELLTEQAKFKQRLKEQAEQAKIQSTNPRESNSAPIERLNKPFVVTKLPASEVEQLRVPKTSSTHDVKSPTPSTSPQKPKNLIRLFPQTPTPKHIDCWKDVPHEAENEQVFDPNQHYISHNPKPLVVNSFNGWMMDKRQPVFNRKLNYSWRSITTSLNSRPPSVKAAKNNNLRTGIHFTPLPSAKIPESLKRSSDHSRLCSCNDEVSSFSDSVFTNYATSPSPSVCSLVGQQATHNSLFKSASIDNSALTRHPSISKKSQTKRVRMKRNTVDVAKSPRHLLQMPNQADASSFNMTTSLSHDTMDIASLLCQGQNQFVVASESETSSYSLPSSSESVFKIPNDVGGLLGLSGSNHSQTQSHTPGRKRNLSGKTRHNSLPKTKHEASPLNGLSSNSLDPHTWSHNVMHTGNNNLLQQNATANNNIADTVSFDFNDFTQGAVKCIEEVTHNSNNNNNSQGSSFEVLLTSSAHDSKGIGSHAIEANGQTDLMAAVGQGFDLHHSLEDLTSPKTEQIMFSNERIWES